MRGYYVDTVGRNEAKIAEYVRNQLEEDIMSDQISMKEYYDPLLRLEAYSERLETQAGNMPLKGLCIPRVQRVVLIDAERDLRYN